MKSEEIINEITNILKIKLNKEEYESSLEKYAVELNCFSLNFKKIMDNIELFLKGKYKIQPESNYTHVNQCFVLNYPFGEYEERINFEYINKKLGMPKISNKTFSFSIAQKPNREESISFDFKYNNQYTIHIRTPNYPHKTVNYGGVFERTLNEYSMEKLQSYHNNNTHNFHKRIEELKAITVLFNFFNGSKLSVKDFLDSKKHYTFNEVVSILESPKFIEKAEVLYISEDSMLLLNVNKKIKEIKNQEVFEKCRQDFLINKYFK